MFYFPIAAVAALPLWEPVWQLNKSTAANICNATGYMDILPQDAGDIGEFGVLT
jgi:hypothetical protein